MNSERERAEAIIDGLHAWYEVTGLSKPTAAQVESMLIIAGDRGVTLDAAEWSEVWKLGDDRIARLHNIICGHMTDAGDDECVAAVLELWRDRAN